jgi:hypothetical protein
VHVYQRERERGCERELERAFVRVRERERGVRQTKLEQNKKWGER